MSQTPKQTISIKTSNDSPQKQYSTKQVSLETILKGGNFEVTPEEYQEIKQIAEQNPDFNVKMINDQPTPDTTNQQESTNRATNNTTKLEEPSPQKKKKNLKEILWIGYLVLFLYSVISRIDFGKFFNIISGGPNGEYYVMAIKFIKNHMLGMNFKIFPFVIFGIWFLHSKYNPWRTSATIRLLNNLVTIGLLIWSLPFVLYYGGWLVLICLFILFQGLFAWATPWFGYWIGDHRYHGYYYNRFDDYNPYDDYDDHDYY
ncbi:hypothetical protein B808_133 [Fructilactobacillus florum 8D]|uniref:Uncharacterized protein n=2 Tax=Fructilactobacillus florum TaxID=640331 RepID=W9EFS3_9LACO|nr:hypothetical protein [Fructilactobacillus florum]EKK20768.1 hypothetical protein B807_445 [Fructilactobacillus florum 2F]ETO40978.1 hypothetical protein B808_133 [Fructilactobacillus florum 8D]KRM91203.1 hypothetical protein FC87_GL001132 [Fructilactobacillus florum DSM 22689 = JCM 16035]